MDRYSFFKKLYHKFPVLCYDLASIPLALIGAFWLRYNLQPFYSTLEPREFSIIVSLILLAQATTYFSFQVYRGLWRFASLSDVFKIIKAGAVAIFLVTPILYFMSLLTYIPRSVFPIYMMNLMGFWCGGRLVARYLWDLKHNQYFDKDAKRVLVVGAGLAGEALIRDLKRASGYHLVGVIDDNPSKLGIEIHGVRAIGRTKQLSHFVNALSIDLVLIAIPSASSRVMRVIVEQCQNAKVQCRTLPSLNMLASGRVEVSALREVNIDDLLGRSPVRLNWDAITNSIEDKVILVTGAGGSIGSELCRQIARLTPKNLILLDHSEYLLYQIEKELLQDFPDLKLTSMLVSITDEVGIRDCFSCLSPQIIFHAAAYKHVPMLEKHVRAAVKNNMIGTKIVADASVKINAEKFILISTDKAVNPTNVLGATKRSAEIYCQNLNQFVPTQFITVRFGNVLDSAGSVVPLFKEQIKKGGPVTVTHPEITRFFMTIPEASQLILQAMVDGVGGEIFVLDMGDPVKISYLAEKLISLAGKKIGEEIEIVFTGLRPGEKLFEELFHDNEFLQETSHEKLFKVAARSVNFEWMNETLTQLKLASDKDDVQELLFLLKQLVPEFSHLKMQCVEEI